jgi:hypothetical protein|tara:strand:- start:7277 stop:7558 length:282 start_codon:yes stop_codon:yes gene_type:complete
MGANQMYKESGSTLPFTQWLNREKAKGVVIPQKGVSDTIDEDLQKQLIGENEKEFSNFTDDKNKIFGLNKTILILSGVIIIGAIAYKVYVKKK